ncbi:MAG TPA: hypothetical protein PLY87_15665 [Planctomycetaceae bacterium]|nr:hypothetical protein [Planctomycetaceae bacterium]
MTNIPSLEPSPDAIIQGLHKIRETMADAFGGDLKALTADARKRQKESGRKVWHAGTAKGLPTDSALPGQNTPAST